MDTPVILPAVVVQLDPDPVAGCEMGLPDVPHRRGAPVGELDDLPDLEILHHAVDEGPFIGWPLVLVLFDEPLLELWIGLRSD